MVIIILLRTMSSLTLSKLRKKTPLEKVNKVKKKIDRFDGLTEDEVQKYTLPDYLQMDLNMVFVGINPSLMAAHRGRYYAGPGNHFYKLLHESGLTPRLLTYEEDYKLPRHGIGLTNIVARATRSSADLKRTEIKEGSKIVEEKLKLYKPKIAVFNGKCIYEVFANKTGNFNFGLQPERIQETTAVWVTPSSSARCANFPRMADKLHFFTSLKRYLQYLNGEIKQVDIKEFSFEGKCKQFIPRTSKMWRRKNVSAFLHGGRIANKDTVCMDTSDENVAVARSTEFIVMKLQTSNDDTEESESKSLETVEMCVSLNNDIKTFFQNDHSPPKEDSQLVKNIETDTHGIEKYVKSESTTSKNQTSNNKKKTNFKRLPQKSVRSSEIEKNTDLDFVNLIKQRLMKKVEHEFDNELSKC